MVEAAVVVTSPEMLACGSQSKGLLAALRDGRGGRAVEEMNGFQKTGSRPCSIIKAWSGPPLLMLHSEPHFFFCK